MLMHVAGDKPAALLHETSSLLSWMTEVYKFKDLRTTPAQTFPGS